MIPTFKKGDKLLESNYRPISLLPNINKTTHSWKSAIVYKSYNLDFRAEHFTQHALVSLTEMARMALDEGNFAWKLDFQKAFATVNHSILSKKLEHYGVRGLANDWFPSYLTNRKQFVSINGFESTLREMKYGFP